MNWNNIPNGERLRLWKKLREEIESADFDLQLHSVAKFCASMPIGHRTVDYYTPDSWPTPWEILFHGTFCPSSVSLLIFHTLCLLPDNGHTFELYLVEDEDVYLLPVIDNQFVLNYQLGAVNRYSEVSANFKVLKKIPQTTIKTIT
jgi:hypothetical protein